MVNLIDQKNKKFQVDEIEEKYDEIAQKMLEVMATMLAKRQCNGLERYDYCYELSED